LGFLYISLYISLIFFRGPCVADCSNGQSLFSVMLSHDTSVMLSHDTSVMLSHDTSVMLPHDTLSCYYMTPLSCYNMTPVRNFLKHPVMWTHDTRIKIFTFLQQVLYPFSYRFFPLASDWPLSPDHTDRYYQKR